MSTHRQLRDTPSQFATAVEQLRTAVVRPEVVVEPQPAPTKIAPHAYALGGEIDGGEDELASGRFVLLHDPFGQDGWEGAFRCVTLARAEIEGDLADDPVLPSVCWSWLTDALAAREAEVTASGGSVTVVHTESFGAIDGDPPRAQIEVRASWTPLTGAAEHLGAWTDLLAKIAGLPPLPTGAAARTPEGPSIPAEITYLDSRRRGAGRR
ncbi:MAG: DUF3000 domain-containing protein [Aeromicrobium sp.]|uniref:DUF3000 domain-containing protein n=1 Tax=Aeromicrobium sp. TaxID=1871063 RepID=UPI0039E6917A